MEQPDEDLSGVLDVVEAYLLGEAPTLTRVQVAEQAGVPLPVAEELWRLLGFPHAADDDIAFTDSDVEALRFAQDLTKLGILSEDRQAALVRTWGRSYARLAEWQVSLLADLAMSQGGLAESLPELAATVMPRVEALQNYAWRRHLLSAASRLLAVGAAGSTTVPMAVVFVDIVGFTSRSKTLSEAELVDWVEHFEDECARIVVDHGGRIIKNIGDEVLFVTEDVAAAAEAALTMTARGADPEDGFPAVRAGLAYGDVVARLGDVFGPTVNVASRLTSVARPGTVLVDRGAHDALVGEEQPEPRLVGRIAALARGDSDDEVSGAAPAGTGKDADGAGPPDGEPAALPTVGLPVQPVDDPRQVEESDGDRSTDRFELRRMRRTSVKGYSRLQSWVLRRREEG